MPWLHVCVFVIEGTTVPCFLVIPGHYFPGFFSVLTLMIFS